MVIIGLFLSLIGDVFLIKEDLFVYGLGSYATPVAFYFLAIIVMDWQAISLAMEQKTKVFYSLGFAAVLFSCSDAIIAYKKFKHDFKIAEVLILSFYWLSIFLICLSCTSLG